MIRNINGGEENLWSSFLEDKFTPLVATPLIFQLYGSLGSKFGPSSARATCHRHYRQCHIIFKLGTASLNNHWLPTYMKLSSQHHSCEIVLSSYLILCFKKR